MKLDEIHKAWNEDVCDDTNRISQVSKITSDRRLKMKARLEEGMPWEECFEKIKASDFLQGFKENHPWRINFDWLFVNGKNWRKVMEGIYDNKDEKKNYNFDVGKIFFKDSWMKLAAAIRKIYEVEEIDAMNDKKETVKAVRILRRNY